MSELVDKLREKIRNEDETVYGNKKGVYLGMLAYLEDHAVVSSRELDNAFNLLKETDLVDNLAYYVAYCNPGGNPWIRTSDVMKKISLKDAAQGAFQDEFPDFETEAVSRGNSRGSGIRFYYTDEKKMLEYVRENVKLKKKVLKFEFNPNI